jgi:hypothetical protein
MLSTRGDSPRSVTSIFRSAPGIATPLLRKAASIPPSVVFWRHRLGAANGYFTDVR